MKESKLHKEREIEEIIDRKLAEMMGEHFKIKQIEEERRKEQETKLINEEPQHEEKPEEKKRPLPPKHPLLKKPVKIDFDFEEQFDLILDIFNDEATAEAAIRALKESPTEIQVIAKLIIDLHEKFDQIAEDYGYRI